jgi:hypothetical protein
MIFGADWMLSALEHGLDHVGEPTTDGDGLRSYPIEGSWVIATPPGLHDVQRSQLPVPTSGFVEVDPSGRLARIEIDAAPAWAAALAANSPWSRPDSMITQAEIVIDINLNTPNGAIEPPCDNPETSFDRRGLECPADLNGPPPPWVILPDS